MINGLVVILLSLLPAIIYSLIIYVTVPYKTIKLKTIFTYLLLGFGSVGLLKWFWVIYPEWHQLANNMADPKVNSLTYNQYYFFVQIGLIEELCKLVVFFLIETFRRETENVKDHPLATMLYMAMVSLGFAVVENIQYGLSSVEPTTTLYWRAITAVIAHMVFGLFMGYWIAMGRMGKRFYDRSLFDIVINTKKNIRNIIYTFIALGAATILHGVYDLHIFLSGPNGITGIYILLIMSILGAYWCFRHLVRSYNIKQKHLKG
jgi:RsiW-degrading membrane proteinase PrsW (M82 family)